MRRARAAANPTHPALADAEPRCFWLDRPGAPVPAPPLEGACEADLLVVGAGFTGLWAALLAKEAEPAREVALLEAETVAFGASGRNGGFVSASLTHGLSNGLERWPAQMPLIERLGRENHAALVAAIERHGIDAELEQHGALSVATEPHQLAWLGEMARQARRFGWSSDVLDRDATQAQVRSPTYLGAVWQRDGEALVDPAALAWGLAGAIRRLGVRVFERTTVRQLRRDGAGVRAATAAGTVRARRAILATNAFPPLVRQVRRFIAPVYDYVLVSEPLDAAQRAAIGWAGRQGVSDLGNQFHYYRLTPDDRILWGGYDAIHYYGSRVAPALDQRAASFDLLARNLLATFPQLEGIRFTHRWGGAIDTCSRFSVMFARALGGRAVYVGGFTGLGVGASRFGALTALDLVDDRQTERTGLELVRRRPVPFPPEPLRSLGIEITRRELARADRNGGRRGPWLRTLDRLGMGFDS
ncbi:MAG TPA: FAD-dependent oxidoreductase [Solirubrobacteraceae bacterium]|nr:FAD-dependent oxidoreductase [Solirubrobacteraceae bacterium]